MSKFKLKQGDNLELLKKLPDNSIDSIVTDPPYGLSFMNKKWDYDVPSVELWKEVYRVLKPGGHVLSFGGTRTYHRMVVNIEDAGFEIRDQIMWLYGSGFPKSHNIGKAVDKLEGNEREVVGSVVRHDFKDPQYIEQGSMMKTDMSAMIDLPITKGQSKYEGWGTALKPANEPICVARKPLSERSVAENVLKWGTGGINVDGCRVGTEGGTMKVDIDKDSNTLFEGGRYNSGKVQEINEGRFPANIILECICDELIKGEKGEIKKSGFRIGGKSENSVGLNGIKNAPDNYGDSGDIHTNPMCPCRLLDEQSGILKSGFGEIGSGDSINDGSKVGMKGKIVSCYADKGGASRFFYVAKVSKKERNMGLDGFEEKKASDLNNRIEGSAGLERREGENGTNPYLSISSNRKNTHPTVKPINLMAYLCRLITPPGGTILDPYMGSGSTGIAALLEGFNFIGMDLDPEYVKIAEARINSYEDYREFLKNKK